MARQMSGSRKAKSAGSWLLTDAASASGIFVAGGQDYCIAITRYLSPKAVKTLRVTL